MRSAIRILRNLVLLLIAAIVVLAAVLVANAWRKPSQQIAVSPVAPVTIDKQAAAQRLSRTIREIFPDAIVVPGLMVAATDSRNYLDVTDNIFRFSPVRATAEDLTRFHGTNERISVENYADMIRFYRRLVQNTAQ